MAGIPVITVDGPSGAGKGTVSHMLADVGLALPRQRRPLPGDRPGLPDRGRELGRPPGGGGDRPPPAGELSDTAASGEILVAYKGRDVSREIRTEGAGAARPPWRPFRRCVRPAGPPAGVPAGARAGGDGRDMGTVVSLAAPSKFSSPPAPASGRSDAISS